MPPVTHLLVLRTFFYCWSGFICKDKGRKKNTHKRRVSFKGKRLQTGQDVAVYCTAVYAWSSCQTAVQCSHLVVATGIA